MGILWFILGVVVGAGGLFVWARYNKAKALAAINASVAELWKFLDDEVLGDLDEEVAAKIKEFFDKLFGKA